MGRSLFRQATQVWQSDVFTDNVAPSAANYETNPVSLEDDLNNLRSMGHNLLKLQTGNWYDDIATPVTFEGGAKRGVDALNQDLHDLERKRVLTGQCSLVDVTVTAAQNWETLAIGELPSNTTAAVGAVTTLGTVAAFHTGTFDTHSLVEVAGATAISPKNLCVVVDGATRDPILSGDRTVFALFQTETATDGHTMTGTTPVRAQLSFVRINATGDDLEACPVVDIAGKTINYCSVERKSMLNLTEQDFLRPISVDVPASATVTRQVAYDNQGTTPVDLTTNAVLDLEGAGLIWSVRDDLEADLFRIIEGSAGGTSTVEISAATDVFDVNAASNDFLQGVTVDSGGTAIDIGATSPGVVTSAGLLTLESTAADLKLDSGAQLVFTDQWQAGSGYATDFVLADSSAEWDAFETAFGEVSLMNALVQAYNHGARGTKVYAVLTANVAANNDVGGVGGGANLDAQLPDMSTGTFLTDYDVFLNGELLRPGANAAANNDYYPGTSLANGQLMFEFNLKGVGANPDVICVIPYV
jgi:hypothetical protein